MKIEKEKLLEAIIRLGTFKAAAKEFGCSPSHIRNLAKKHNIKSPAKLDERKYKVNDNFLDYIGPKQVYFIGLIAADGCIKESKKCKTDKYRQLSLGQSNDTGLKIIQYIIKLLDSDCKIYYKEKANTYRFNITSVPITKKLISMGITPRKTESLIWPKEISGKLSSHFLRGYIDGDGSLGIYKRGHGEYLTLSYVGTKEFIYESKKHLPTQNVSIYKIKRCNNLYSLSASGLAAEEISEWLWNDADFKSYKFNIYNRWMNEYNPKYRRYKMLKIKAKALYHSGLAPNEISKELGISFQTIYKWKRKFNW